MVGAREAAVAHPALEGLGPGVLPVVAGQFVGAREPPVAAFPGALVGLFTCANEGKEVKGSACKQSSQILPEKELFKKIRVQEKPSS